MSASVIILPVIRIEQAGASELHLVQGRISSSARATLLRLSHKHHGGDLGALVSELLEHCATAVEQTP